MVEYTENVSGFKVVGDWDDVVELGEKIAYSLKECADIDDRFASEFEDYDDWRPKIEDRMTEISDRTARKASIDENDTEEEIGKIDKNEIYEYIENNDNTKIEKMTDLSESIAYIIKTLELYTRKSIRSSEEAIYKNLMTSLSPYYFDNELVSANMDKNESGEYYIEINVNDDDLKDCVSEKLEEYSELDRWHLEQKGTKERIEDVEDVDIKHDKDSDPLDPQNNGN